MDMFDKLANVLWELGLYYSTITRQKKALANYGLKNILFHPSRADLMTVLLESDNNLIIGDMPISKN
jgi:hypothetical protein